MPLVDYTPRNLIRHIERDRDTPLRLGVYRDGAIVEPTSGTVVVYNAANTAVFTSAVTIDGSDFANATVLASDVAAQAYGPGWRVEWTMVMPDGASHVYRFSTALVRVRYACPVTDLDLLSRHPDLNSYLPSGQTSWQTQVDAAWEDAQDWIEGKGRRVYLVTSQDAFRPWVRTEALALVCAMLAGNGSADNSWAQRAAAYAQDAVALRDGLTLEYDEYDAGVASAATRVAAEPVVWLCGSPDWAY